MWQQFLLATFTLMKHPWEASFRVLSLFVVPSRDLAVVLEGLSMAPFKPLESASEQFLTLKVFFLLAITKKAGDLQALSVASSCLEFAPGGVKAILHSRPNYVPKVLSSVSHL